MICRHCEEPGPITWSGYCSRACELEDILISLFDLEGSLCEHVGA